MARYTAQNPADLGSRVFLGGVEIKNVCECDDEMGWIIRLATDKAGRPILDAGEFVRHERLEGIVTVIRPVR